MGIASLYTISLTLNGAAYPGDVVTMSGETHPDVDQAVAASAGEGCLGFIRNPCTPADTHTLDTQILDGVQVDILLKGAPGVVVYLKREAISTVAAVKGETAVVGTEGGKIRRRVYADGSAYTDTLVDHVGQFDQSIGTDDTDDQIVAVKLGSF